MRYQPSHLDLAADLESKALTYLAAAQREAEEDVGVGGTVSARQVAKVGIIGAGTMGGGIAMAFANAGYPTLVVEANAEALKRGMELVERNYATSVKRGSLSEEQKSERMSRLDGTLDFDLLARCDLVIEAVFEDMAVKAEVFERLGSVAKPGAVLATNTSYLDVDRIAQASGRARDVIGLHFFSPANVMKLLEIVRGRETPADVVATALSVAHRIGKVAVVVGVCHGFVGNRMLAARNLANEPLLLAGASPAEIDKAFTDFGWPMGPFQMNDLAGLDIGWRNRKTLGKKALLADALCESGQFGQKSGSGWYRYEAGSRTPLPNPFVDELIDRTARELNVARRKVDAEEIIERTLLPMMNEGARILEEGIAQRASDIDLVWVNGYGFPTAKGGPMWFADQLGLDAVVGKLESVTKDAALPIQISPLLQRLAAERRSLAAWRPAL